MDQHRRSPLSEATVRCHPESSRGLVFAGVPGFSTQLWGLLVPDATGISTGSDRWNNSPFLSTTQQHGNGLYPPIVGQADTMCNPLLGNHHTTLFQSDGPEMTNDCLAFTDIIADSNDHEHLMTLAEEALSMTPFGAMPQEALRTHNEGNHLVISAPEPPSQLCTQRGTEVENTTKKLYECSFCNLKFAQRQGLKRHKKDKHEPKQGCSFCAQFTWSQGRRYVYRRHLQEEHPGVVLPSLDAALVARRRSVNLEGRSSRQNSIFRPSS
ncbi:hypothetical protein EDB92DRAFT_1108538 [Lactarius akahatsu]|uniref:C2H2-type domain-containing protein n=1 Tax=Lactarius akahatsu TaxID=416441 RepID=A0AAD4L5C7_9AGAM|nr:hypothetical protein EDB92DRAFT_1108538 [Lactarius akahatsu]